MHNFIFKIGFSKLKKQEVYTLASRVLTIVGGHDPEGLLINEIYDSLAELKPQIEALDLGYIAHPISKPLNEMRKQRIAFAQGIINQIDTIERGKISGKEEAIVIAKPILLQHLKGVSKKSDDAIYHSIHSLIVILSKDLKFSAALDTLELFSYFTSLQNVNSKIEEQLSLRKKDIAARPKLKTREIVANLKVAILDLFKQIEVAHLKNKELDYMPLIDDLNKDIAILKTAVKTRASYNKKKAEAVLNDKEVVEKDNEVVIENESETPSEPAPTVQRMYPFTAEVGNGNSEQLDIKKTVAMSSNPMRLPLDASEA